MATLDQVFQHESAWIAASVDVDALMDKIQDWGDSIRAAERDGNMLVRMRAGDLVELAQKRVVRLSASVIRAEAAPAPAKRVAAKVVEPRVEPRVLEPVRAPGPPARGPEPESRPAQRKVDDEAARAAVEKAKADARIASAEAAKMELENELLRAQVEAARRVTAAPAPVPPAAGPKARTPERAVPTKVVAGPAPRTATAASSVQTTTAAQAPRSKVATVPRNDDEGYTEADRLALASVGHWPPTPEGHRGAFWSKHDDWPRDWTLTGGDLGRFRGEINLTRAVFAAQLGVPSAVVKDAELSPREKVGPALQIAVRRAMDHAIQARRAQREKRAAAQATPESAAAAVPSVPAPVVVVQAAGVAPRSFTGADLARLRRERRLSQREMADLLGVEQGTISKGEGKAGSALGPALQEALRRVAAGGGAGLTSTIPE
jgi:DNA-binding transcriptional regulator YiaG